MLAVAAAPTLMRRAKGVFGVLPESGAKSSSSMAFSSIEPELVDKLPRLMLAKTDGVVGDVPERPIVFTESRRPRPSLGDGIGGTLLADGPRENRLDSAA